MTGPIGAWWHVEHEITDEAIVVRVKGEIDIATAPKFAQALATVPAERAVVIDLTQVEYLDLTAVRVVEEFSAHRRRANRPIIAGPRPQVRRILQLVGFGRRFRITGTVDEALATLRPPRVEPDD